jgi:hypothetical protein
VSFLASLSPDARDELNAFVREVDGLKCGWFHERAAA